MTRWAWCGDIVTSDGGDVRTLRWGADLTDWYTSLPSGDLVFTWEGDGEELLRLPETRPETRWTGRVGGGSLLSLRAKGGAEVREASALLPWLEPPPGEDEGRSAWLLLAVEAELRDLAARGYEVMSSRGPRLTVGAVAWASACAMAGVEPNVPREWGEYDAGRRAYYGGRCEVGQVRCPRVEGWDISGAYPWALLQPVPVGRRRVALGPRARRAYERGAPGAYWARIEQPRDGIPRVPYRHLPTTGRGRSRGPLLWVTGHVEGWYVAHELAAAEDSGAVVEVTVAHLWESEAPVWAPYLEHTTSDRAELRAAGRSEMSAKLLANCLSGKLAQGPEATSVRVLGESERPELGWGWHGGRVWSKKHRHVPSCSRPIEAATLTARVRVELLRELLRTRDRWVYCDTDSIWVTPGDGPSSDRCPWRLVDRGTGWHAPAPKTYLYTSEGGEEVVKAAGIPAGMATVLGAFARGEPACPRRHPDMPDLPYGPAHWVGLRRVHEEGGRTVPLHRDRAGELS